MRAFWMAMAFALLASEAAIADPVIIGRTNMTSDPGHGTQVEYLQSGGGAFLWYPGNKIVLPGHWKMDAGTSTQPGVTVNLAGGGTATILFNRDTPGAKITLNGVTTTLDATVDSLPQGHL